MKLHVVRHEFVDFIPDELEEAVLYVSIRYRTASHLCACGCGRKVVTPIKPSRWALLFDGATVSLWPSIGRWQLPCRSHYWIENDKIRWAPGWTDEQIVAGREQDALDIRRYYASRSVASKPAESVDVPSPGNGPGRLVRAWRKLRRH